MEESKDTININGKVVGVLVILILLVSGTFGMFLLNEKEHTSSSNPTISNNNANTPTDSKYSDLPEECRPPAGQDINAWKEHLGHHENTRECLQYFK